MLKRTAALLLGIAIATATACQSDAITACPADPAQVRMSPRAQTVAVGSSFQPTARAFVCGGTQEVEFTGVWRSRDTAVAIVDTARGRVTARMRGVTFVRAQYFGRFTGNPNGGTWDSIQITVP